MNLIFFLLLSTLALQASSHYYECIDGYELHTTLKNDAAKLHLPRGDVTLPKVPSSTHSTYTDGKMKLVVHEDSALLWLDALGAIECRLSDKIPSAAPTLASRASTGTSMRKTPAPSIQGAGHGWTLSLSPKQGFLSYDQGLGQLRFLPPQGRMSGDFTHYMVRNGNQRLIIDLQQRRCNDPKGESLPLTVSMSINGTSLRGCAKYVTQ